jgi:hypothetical protein
MYSSSESGLGFDLIPDGVAVVTGVVVDIAVSGASNVTCNDPFFGSSGVNKAADEVDVKSRRDRRGRLDSPPPPDKLWVLATTGEPGVSENSFSFSSGLVVDVPCGGCTDAGARPVFVVASLRRSPKGLLLAIKSVAAAGGFLGVSSDNKKLKSCKMNIAAGQYTCLCKKIIVTKQARQYLDLAG